jgi:exodeoxyribonuclease VII small subunit
MSAVRACLRSLCNDLPARYEDALAELERLVQAMEAGQLPLDQLLDSYRRGAELLEQCRSQLQAVESAGEGAGGRTAEGLDRTHERHCRPPGCRTRLQRWVAAGEEALSRWVPADAPAGLGAGHALRRARRRQAVAAAAGAGRLRGGRRRPGRRHARGRGGGTDPRLFAGPRRHAVHGQRRAAPRQADGACAVRRGRRHAGRRCDAGPGLRGADAGRGRR